MKYLPCNVYCNGYSWRSNVSLYVLRSKFHITLFLTLLFKLQFPSTFGVKYFHVALIFTRLVQSRDAVRCSPSNVNWTLITQSVISESICLYYLPFNVTAAALYSSCNINIDLLSGTFYIMIILTWLSHLQSVSRPSVIIYSLTPIVTFFVNLRS